MVTAPEKGNPYSAYTSTVVHPVVSHPTGTHPAQRGPSIKGLQLPCVHALLRVASAATALQLGVAAGAVLLPRQRRRMQEDLGHSPPRQATDLAQWLLHIGSSSIWGDTDGARIAAQLGGLDIRMLVAACAGGLVALAWDAALIAVISRLERLPRGLFKATLSRRWPPWSCDADVSFRQEPETPSTLGDAAVSSGRNLSSSRCYQLLPRGISSGTEGRTIEVASAGITEPPSTPLTPKESRLPGPLETGLLYDIGVEGFIPPQVASPTASPPLRGVAPPASSDVGPHGDRDRAASPAPQLQGTAKPVTLVSNPDAGGCVLSSRPLRQKSHSHPEASRDLNQGMTPGLDLGTMSEGLEDAGRGLAAGLEDAVASALREGSSSPLRQQEPHPAVGSGADAGCPTGAPTGICPELQEAAAAPEEPASVLAPKAQPAAAAVATGPEGARLGAGRLTPSLTPARPPLKSLGEGAGELRAAGPSSTPAPWSASREGPGPSIQLGMGEAVTAEAVEGPRYTLVPSTSEDAPEGTAASGRGTAPARPRRPGLYASPVQHVTVALKLEPPGGVPYERVASALTATAHRTVDDVLNVAEVAGAGALGGGGGGGGGSGGAGGGCGGRGGSHSGRPRWLGYTTQVHCLRGCVEVVLRLQYKGGEADEQELSTAAAKLEQALWEQLAALASAGGAGPSTAMPSGTRTAEAATPPAPPRSPSPAEYPATPLGLPSSFTARPAGVSLALPPGAAAVAATAAAVIGGVSVTLSQSPNVAPLVVYMDPPVIAAAGAAASPSFAPPHAMHAHDDGGDGGGDAGAGDAPAVGGDCAHGDVSGGLDPSGTLTTYRYSSSGHCSPFAHLEGVSGDGAAPACYRAGGRGYGREAGSSMDSNRSSELGGPYAASSSMFSSSAAGVGDASAGPCRAATSMATLAVVEKLVTEMASRGSMGGCKDGDGGLRREEAGTAAGGQIHGGQNQVQSALQGPQPLPSPAVSQQPSRMSRDVAYTATGAEAPYDASYFQAITGGADDNGRHCPPRRTVGAAQGVRRQGRRGSRVDASTPPVDGAAGREYRQCSAPSLQVSSDDEEEPMRTAPAVPLEAAAITPAPEAAKAAAAAPPSTVLPHAIQDPPETGLELAPVPVDWPPLHRGSAAHGRKAPEAGGGDAQVRPGQQERRREGDAPAVEVDCQRESAGCVHLELFIDATVSGAGGGGGHCSSSGSSSTTNVHGGLRPFSAVPGVESAHRALPADVRVVVKQHGVVVAEVEWLRVGPRGASVSLDLSGLEEGSAALMVLPYRPPRHGGGEGTTGRQDPRQGHEDVAPLAALFYTSIAVVPPVVAAELCGLMGEMQRSATTGATAEAEAASRLPATDPRVIRARVFTHHFSPLVSDMVSLLLGCERLADEAAELGDDSVGWEAPGPGAYRDLEHHRAQVQELCVEVVSYLYDMGLKETIVYLLGEVQDAGVQVLSGDLVGEQAIRNFLRQGAGGMEAGPGPQSSTPSRPPSRAAAEAVAATASSQNIRGIEGGSGSAGAAAEAPAGDRSAGPDVARGGRAPGGVPGITEALRAVLAGWSQPGLEQRFVAFLSRDAGSQSWTVTVALAVLQALGVAVVVAAATEVAGSTSLPRSAGSTSRGGPAPGSGSIAAANNGGRAAADRPWRLPQGWWPELVLTRTGVLVAVAAAALACMALQATLRDRTRGGGNRQRRRELLVLWVHNGATVLLLAAAPWLLPGPLAPALWVLAALLVVVQPAAGRVRFLAHRGCWAADLVLLAALAALNAYNSRSPSSPAGAPDTDSSGGARGLMAADVVKDGLEGLASYRSAAGVASQVARVSVLPSTARPLPLLLPALLVVASMLLVGGLDLRRRLRFLAVEDRS